MSLLLGRRNAMDMDEIFLNRDKGLQHQ